MIRGDVSADTFAIILTLLVISMAWMLIRTPAVAVYTNQFQCTDERIVDHSLVCFQYNRVP